MPGGGWRLALKGWDRSDNLGRRHSLELTLAIEGKGGEKLKKAKAAVAKLEKDIADGETDAAKKAVQVGGEG
eukprot:1161635-Pelagomonas_calceolata.AAC.21